MNVPKEVDLNFSRKLPTKPRIEYLHDKVGIKTVREAYTAFAKHLNTDKTSSASTLKMMMVLQWKDTRVYTLIMIIQKT